MINRFKKNAELNRPDADTFRKIEKMPVVVVLDNVRSGLNTGSVFRSADSFMAERICLCGITARPPDKEILKSALGATETVSWKHYLNTEDAIVELRNEGYIIYAVEQAEEAVMLSDLHLSVNQKYAVIFGHEVKGVDESLIPLIDGCIEIPQSGTKHSLNVSVCAGIVLWKFYEKLQLAQ
jgi:23S rRNA (guanosine2251-2'-O)-methyltransferase